MVAPRARNEHGTIEYIVDAEADLASIVGPQESAFALAMAEKTLHVFKDSSWQVISGAAGAPSTVDYLVGTADATLSAEIVVGATPGGELGGTWAAPTVDATHSGSAHHAQLHATSHEPGGGDAMAVDAVAGTGSLRTLGAGALTAAAGNHSHAGAGHTIADAGVAETQRATLDFQDGFEVVDNAGANSTDVDLSYGGAGYPLDVAAAEADGTAITVARSDHVHAHGAGYSADAHHAQSHDHSAAGDGTALRPVTLDVPSAAAPTPTTLAEMAFGTTEVSLFVGDGAATQQFLRVSDAGSDPLVVDNTAAADGTEDTVARKDHRHLLGAHSGASHTDPAAATTVDIGDTAAAGTGTNPPAADDHTHGFPAPSAAYPVDTTFAAEADGTATTPARSDHRHTITDPTTLPAAIAYGTAASAEGTATDVARADHNHGSTQTFTISSCYKTPAVDTYAVWRAPFACTVTALRGYADVGTTATINAAKGSLASPTNFSTADLTINAADSWVSDTTLDTTAIAAGDAVLFRITGIGTAGEITIQLDLTRP